MCTIQMMEHIRRPWNHFVTLRSISFALILDSFPSRASPLLPSEEEAADNIGARGRKMQRDELEAGGTRTMLLDSKILARLAGADERLFHRTLSLQRRPATTRTSTITTMLPLPSLLQYGLGLSALSYLLSPFVFVNPSSLFCWVLFLSFACDASFVTIPTDRWRRYVPLKLSAFPPRLRHSILLRRFLYIFSIALPNSGAEIDFNS